MGEGGGVIRAHELLGCLKPGSQEYMDAMASVKFDLGAIEAVRDFQALSTGTFFEIPADICLFQVSDTRARPDFYLAKRDFGGVVWRRYLYSTDLGWCREDVEFFIEANGANPMASRISSKTMIGLSRDWDAITRDEWLTIPEIERNAILRFIGIAMAIEVFSCTNVMRIRQDPPKFINAKRQRKGKIPFFSYWTLHIKDELASSDCGTGTHTPPRLHLRRGHIRRLHDGRRVWVRQCLVGDESKGIVMKDYAVEAA